MLLNCPLTASPCSQRASNTITLLGVEPFISRRARLPIGPDPEGAPGNLPHPWNLIDYVCHETDLRPLTFLFAVAAHAQWLSYPTPDVPRIAEGKPNLSAPAPKNTGRQARPFGRLVRPGGYTGNLAHDLKPGELFSSPGRRAVQAPLRNAGKEMIRRSTWYSGSASRGCRALSF